MVATVRIAAAAQVDLWCSLGGFSTWFFERTRVCPGPKRQLDRFSHFCNADVRDQRGYSSRNVKKCFFRNSSHPALRAGDAIQQCRRLASDECVNIFVDWMQSGD